MCESRKTIYDLIDNKQEGNGYCVKERELYLFILPMRYLWLVLTGLVYTGSLPAQKYHALQGSRYAGSLAVHENPAGIQATPFKWDITVLGAQMKNNTNTFTIRHYSLLSNPRHSLYVIDSGYYKRYNDFSANINLLNARIALGRKQTIAFGINLKSYLNAEAGPYNFIDTLGGSGDFFKINHTTPELSGSGAAAGWGEVYAAYARTVVDNGRIRINAGLTLKAGRTMAGGFIQVNDTRVISPVPGVYEVAGNALYGYNRSFDNTGSNAAQELWKEGQMTVGMDIGAEIVIKPEQVVLYQEDDYYDYDWKFGVALLDAGRLPFRYGVESRRLVSIRPGVTNAVLDDKFQYINSLAELNDSLATIADLSVLSGSFYIQRPARLMLTADHFLGDYFYISGSAVLHAPAAVAREEYRIRESELLTIVPRWEKRTAGIYLPLQLNYRGRFWAGGAFRIGPLLLGIHNWANVFSKNKMQRGGGYIAFHFRSQEWSRRKFDRRLNCPVF